MANKKVTQIATIDVAMATIQEDTEGSDVYLLTSASKIGVEPQIETKEANKLIVKGVLIAQKPEESTLTGNVLTLTDNVFSPELVQLLQGGTILYDATETTKIVGYEPPAIGVKTALKTKTVKMYSAQYNAAGEIEQYECITYPGCKGVPYAFGSEDGVFRVSDYKINSTPNTGEKPYKIEYVDTLPAVV